MKPYRTLFVALLLALIGAGEDLRAAQGAAASRSAEAIVTFERFVLLNGQREAEFVVRNASHATLWFSGYGRRSPLYSLELLDGGKWVAAPVGFCGNGIARFALRPGERITFRAWIEPAHDGQPLRAGIGISHHEDALAEAEAIAWSDRLAPPPRGTANAGVHRLPSQIHAGAAGDHR